MAKGQNIRMIEFERRMKGRRKYLEVLDKLGINQFRSVGEDLVVLSEPKLVFSIPSSLPSKPYEQYPLPNSYGMKFSEQRASYSDGFKMSTIPELTLLLFASLSYRDSDVMKRIFRYGRLIGNTGVLYTPQGMFVQDNPETKGGIITMDKETLEGKLGKTQEGNVVFSDDKSVRFTQYGFKNGFQASSTFSKNSGVIALVGSKENAERLANSMVYAGLGKMKPYLSTQEKKYVRSPKIRNVWFESSDNYRCNIALFASCSDSADSVSFGVKKLRRI